MLGFLALQPHCLVVMEACAGAHYWGREIGKLGHEVKLVPPVYVKPFVKRHKNDAADAEAICEAASRPSMRFVAVKSEAQQARGMLFRTRDLLVRQRTQAINALRGHLAEFGVIAPQGRAHLARPASAVANPGSGLPEAVRELGEVLLAHIAGLKEKIQELREATPHERPRGRRGETADEHSGGRSGLRVGDPGLCAADGKLPSRAGLLRLARARAAAALDRRQAAAGQDIEDGPARREAVVDHGRDERGALGGPARRASRIVAGPHAGA